MSGDSDQGKTDERTGMMVLLGLSPLLAASDQLAKGLVLSVTTGLVMILSAAAFSILRSVLPSTLRLSTFLLVSATLASICDLLGRAFLPDVAKSLGIFLPLMAGNGFVYWRMEHGAPIAMRSALHGVFGAALAFGSCLIGLSAVREVIGHGTLSAGFGKPLHIWLMPDGNGLVLATLPAGAFIGLGLLLAAGNAWRKHDAGPPT
jgi:electron transport complex protein RnfE